MLYMINHIGEKNKRSSVLISIFINGHVLLLYNEDRSVALSLYSRIQSLRNFPLS